MEIKAQEVSREQVVFLAPMVNRVHQVVGEKAELSAKPDQLDNLDHVVKLEQLVILDVPVKRVNLDRLDHKDPMVIGVKLDKVAHRDKEEPKVLTSQYILLIINHYVIHWLINLMFRSPFHIL